MSRRCAQLAISCRCLEPLVRHVESSVARARSEEHTSELQSQSNLVCRLLLEKKKTHHLLCSTRGVHVYAFCDGKPWKGSHSVLHICPPLILYCNALSSHSVYSD